MSDIPYEPANPDFVGLPPALDGTADTEDYDNLTDNEKLQFDKDWLDAFGGYF